MAYQNPYQTQQIKPLQSPQAPGQPQPNPYNMFRQQAQARAQTQMQENQNALQRRFAQLGGGPGGAQIKMEQDLQRQGNEDLSNQIGSINAQEAQANQAQNQFQQQFGLEQTKTLAGLDLARRDQALNEQGQLFNTAQASMAAPYSFNRQLQEIQRYQGALGNQPGNSAFGDYLAQLQGYANPMLRRLAVDPNGGQANG
jgi:hypothetical protein